VAGAVTSARRYRGVDEALVRRLAEEEAPRARGEADAVKRVKRRLHQAVTAYRPRGGRIERDLGTLQAAWLGRLTDPGFPEACAAVLRRHASTRERLAHLEGFFPAIWSLTGGAPRSLLDLGCGLGPLLLPWMGLGSEATYHAVDVDEAQLGLVDAFLSLVGQPHAVEVADLATDGWQGRPVDVALLLKLVPLLDRRSRGSVHRLLAGLPARHAVVTFPVRSLGGRGKGMERTYRERLETLVRDLDERVAGVAEASVPNELVFVLTLAPLQALDA
jgi:16S rRNA (guanine(1405)-N(7))-methyltransferase